MVNAHASAHTMTETCGGTCATCGYTQVRGTRRRAVLTRDAQLRAAHAESGIVQAVQSWDGSAPVWNGCGGRLPWRVPRVADTPPPPRLAPRPLTWDQRYVEQLQARFDHDEAVDACAVVSNDVFPKQSDRVPVCNPRELLRTPCFDAAADRCKRRPRDLRAEQLRAAMRASEARTDDVTRERGLRRPRGAFRGRVSRRTLTAGTTQRDAALRTTAPPVMRAAPTAPCLVASREHATRSAARGASRRFTGTLPPTAFADSLRYVGAQAFSSC